MIKKIKKIAAKMTLATTIKKKISGLVWDKPVPNIWLSFCPNFLSFCWLTLVAFGDFSFQNFVTNQLIGREFCEIQQVTFWPQQCYEQLIQKTRVSVSLVARSHTGKLHSIHNCLKIRTLQPVFIIFVRQHSQPLYDVMQK